MKTVFAMATWALKYGHKPVIRFTPSNKVRLFQRLLKIQIFTLYGTFTTFLAVKVRRIGYGLSLCYFWDNIYYFHTPTIFRGLPQCGQLSTLSWLARSLARSSGLMKNCQTGTSTAAVNINGRGLTALMMN